MDFKYFLENFNISYIFSNKNINNKLKIQHFILLSLIAFRVYRKELNINSYLYSIQNHFLPTDLENKMFEIFLDGSPQISYNPILQRILNTINIKTTNEAGLIKYLGVKNILERSNEIYENKLMGNYTYENSIFNRSFDSLLAVNIVQELNSEITLVLNKVIDKVIPQEYKSFNSNNSCKSSLYGSYQNFLKNRVRQTTSQKLTYIFNYIFSIMKNEAKIYSASRSNKIEERRARNDRPKNPITSYTSGTFKTAKHENYKRYAIPLKVKNFYNSRYSNQSYWVSGKNDWNIKENNYFLNQEKSGKYYIAGSSGTTINFMLFISTKCHILNEQEKILFLLGIISYLILGGHHSLDEIAQAFYYDVGQIDNYNKTYKDIFNFNKELEKMNNLIYTGTINKKEVGGLLKYLFNYKYTKGNKIIKDTVDDLLCHFVYYFEQKNKLASKI